MGKYNVYTDQDRIADYTAYYNNRLKLKEKRKEFKKKKEEIFKLVNSSKMTMKKFLRKIKQISMDSEV